MKKLLAALTAVALTLLSVVLMPVAASAHSNNITASVSCKNTDGTFDITWTITNLEGSPETLSQSSRLSDQIDGKILAPYSSMQVKENVSQVKTYNLTVVGTWTYDNFSTANTGSLSKNAFPECSIDVTPPAPTFTDSVCTSPGASSAASYTIPSLSGVYFKVDNQTTNAGTYPVASFPKTVTIKAYASNGYQLKGTSQWSHTFSSPGDCKVSVTPLPPTPVQPSKVCVAPGQSQQVPGSVTIPSITGVVYKLNGQVVSGALTNMNPGTYHFSVEAAPGYKLTVQYGFNVTLNQPQSIDCTVDVTPVKPVVSAETCSAPGQQSNGSIAFTLTPGVKFYLNGSLVSSANMSLPDGTYQVSATAASGYRLVGYTGPWSLVVSDAGDCIVTVTPVAPTAESITQCGMYGSIDIPEVDGVTYTVDGNGRTGVNTVTATATAGHKLTDGPHVWVFNLGSYTKCAATPVVSDLTPQQCTADGPGFTPAHFSTTAVEGVTYYLDEEETTGSDLEPGTYTVTAVADEGYSFLPGTVTSWTFDVEYVDCLDEVSPVAPTFVQGVCENGADPVPNTFTIPAIEGVEYVSGEEVLSPGEHFVTEGDVNIEARALDGYKLAPETQSSFTFTFNKVVCNKATTPVTPSVVDKCGVNADALGALPEVEGLTYEVLESSTRSDGSRLFTVAAYPQEGYYVPEGSGYELSDGVAIFQLSSTAVPCQYQPGSFATPACLMDTPWLDYNLVLPDGVDASKGTTITFINPSGDNYVLTGQPLSGRILWPGAAVDPITGKATDWPGWVKNANGSWTQTDDGWAWARGNVEVMFTTNPSMTLSVIYPPATANCTANPPIVGSGGAPRTTTPAVITGSGSARSSLASTGSDMNPWVWTLLATSITASGTGMLIFSRKR